MRVALRKQIPLIGGPSPLDGQLRNPKSPLAHALRGTLTRTDYRRFITDLDIRTRPFALVKPGRRLGAAWIDQFVAERKSVSICAECDRRYAGWAEKYNYEPRTQRELTDCDGCGEPLRVCKGYYYRLRPPQ